MPDEKGVIAGHYRIDPSRPGRVLAGGLRCLPVADRREPDAKLMALQPRPELPARPRITLAKAGAEVPYAVLPVDYGVGRDLEGNPGFFIISEAPPGTPIGVARAPWREQELISCVLLPVAAALIGLESRGLTHRAINPDNLFRAQAGMPVTLGPFFAAPPGSLQPAAYEPPAMARCLPAGRGNGTIADDVYALGVTLLVLATAHAPLDGAADDAVLHQKIERGSYTALTAQVKLPPLIADLLRSMLAEDPEHRPPPKLLLNPEQIRSRRIAARPPRRAYAPLKVGGATATGARDLAHVLGCNPEAAFSLLRNGEVERWLRRSLGDPQLGVGIEEVAHRHQDASGGGAAQRDMLVMRAVSAIDPLSPLVWRGLAVQPDGLGAALVDASGKNLAALQELIAAEAIPAYLDMHPRRAEQLQPREEAREFRRLLTKNAAAGLKRLLYAANPMLSCASPLLPGRTVVRLGDLLPALNDAAATSDTSKPPIDADIAAFIAARGDDGVAGDMPAHLDFADATARLSVLRLFGRLEKRGQAVSMPGLAKWLVSSGFATLNDWRSHSRRADLEQAVKQAADAGQISRIAALVDDEKSRRADAAGAAYASARLKVLETALADINGSETRRAMTARRLGYELATGAGLAGLLIATFRLALP